MRKTAKSPPPEPVAHHLSESFPALLFVKMIDDGDGSEAYPIASTSLDESSFEDGDAVATYQRVRAGKVTITRSISVDITD